MIRSLSDLRCPARPRCPEADRPLPEPRGCWRERCAARGIQTLRGHYYPTAKNGMVKELYASFGFAKTGEDQRGSTWELPLSGYEPRCKVIEIAGNDQ